MPVPGGALAPCVLVPAGRGAVLIFLQEGGGVEPFQSRKIECNPRGCRSVRAGTRFALSHLLRGRERPRYGGPGALCRLSALRFAERASAAADPALRTSRLRRQPRLHPLSDDEEIEPPEDQPSGYTLRRGVSGGDRLLHRQLQGPSASRRRLYDDGHRHGGNRPGSWPVGAWWGPPL